MAGVRGGLEFLFGLPDGGFETLDESTQHVFLANTHTMFPDLEAPVPAPWTTAQLERIRQPVLLVSGDRSLTLVTVLMCRHWSSQSSWHDPLRVRMR